MRTPWDSTLLAGLHVKNRFVRSATWEGLASMDGSCTDRLVDAIAELAEGQVGMIISGHAFVSREGQAGPRQLAIDEDRFVQGLRPMAAAAHYHGSRIFLQLAHAGVHAPNSLTGCEAVGPSALKKAVGSRGRAMTTEEIQDLVDAFAKAALRAKRAGFDGVQIHAAHGYLLSQYLSPHFNHRTDEYGGDVGNRARIVLECLKQIKAARRQRLPRVDQNELRGLSRRRTHRERNAGGRVDAAGRGNRRD